MAVSTDVEVVEELEVEAVNWLMNWNGSKNNLNVIVSDETEALEVEVAVILKVSKAAAVSVLSAS